MKKITLLCALLLAFYSHAIAQPRLGVKVGAAFSNLYDSGRHAGNPYYFAGKSIYGGLTLDFAITENLAIQPGVSLLSKGLVSKGSVSFNTFGEGYYSKSFDQYKSYYIEVPINMVYAFKLGSGKLIGGLGPYYGVAVGGRLAFNDENNFVSNYFPTAPSSSGYIGIKYGKEGAGQLRRNDFGLNGSLGYELKNGFGLQAGYSMGLVDVRSENIGVDVNQTKNRVITTGVFYKFK